MLLRQSQFEADAVLHYLTFREPALGHHGIHGFPGERRRVVSGLERCPGCHPERSEGSLRPASQTRRLCSEPTLERSEGMTGILSKCLSTSVVCWSRVTAGGTSCSHEAWHLFVNHRGKRPMSTLGLPRRFRLTAHPCWRNQWRSQLIRTGHLDTTWSRIRMVGRQRAAPCKCIGSNSLSRAEGDAGRGLSAPIVNRITELNSPTRAIGCNMNGCRIGHNDGCTARQPLNGCRTHRHINFRDLKRRQRCCTLPRWPNE